MKSIREIYKIGKGPSSSHTIGPERAATYFKSQHPDAEAFQVHLFGSLSKTGKGHGTDRVLREVLSPLPTEIVFRKDDPADIRPFCQRRCCSAPFRPCARRMTAWL